MLGLAAFLIYAQIDHILHLPIWRDDAFFASVAKNLANGDGYKAVFFDKDYAFNHGISTGPTVILPAAALMFFFGNQYWVPGAANIALIWCLLIGIFILIEDFVGKKKWPFCLLALSLSLLFSIGSYGNENSDNLILWHSLMGEIPAALCVIVGTLLLFTRQFSAKKMLLGGLFLGLAIMSKVLAAIATLVILISFSLRILKEKIPKKILLIIAAGFCAALPFFLFELVKFISLGWSQYLDLNIKTAEHYRHYGAVITSRQDNGITIYSDIKWNLSVLRGVLGTTYLMLIPATIYVAYAAFVGRNNNNSHCIPAGITLILCCIAHITWWTLFSFGMDRYLVIALICYSVGLSLLMSSIDYKIQSRFQISIICLTIFLLFVPKDKELNYFFSARGGGSDKIAEEMVVADAIRNLKEQGVITVSCGNNFEMEYLLPDSRNFKKCEEILSKSFDRPVMLVSFFLGPKTILSIDHDQYFGNIGPSIPDAILSKCDQEYLKTENFSLNWCK